MAMLNKNCEKVVAALCEDLPNQPSYGYSISDIACLVDLKEEDVIRLAKHLELEGYLEPRKYDLHTGSVFYHYFLTEKGKSYKLIARRQTWDYIKDKWIDFFALIVAIIALVIAIDAHIKLPPN